jgi:hypothetical protein
MGSGYFYHFFPFGLHGSVEDGRCSRIPGRISTNRSSTNGVKPTAYFFRMLIPGGERLRKYGIEEIYQAASRMGIKNSSQELLTETTDWLQELLGDFRAKAGHGLRTSRPSILL